MSVDPIRGSTRLVALLGNPVAHSLSPNIHNRIFRRLGLDFAYVPLRVDPHDVQRAITALRMFGFAGANVTIPHKRAVAPFCDRLSELSRLCGSCNTLYMQNGMLCGDTTDAQGFYRALQRMQFDLSGARVVILGNGGAARTLGFSLALDTRIVSLTFIGRNERKVAGLAAHVQQRTNTAATMRAATFDDRDVADHIAQGTLLVNCTPIGMTPDAGRSPLPRELLKPPLAVFDTIYNPAETLLVRHARDAGCTALNGLAMLLFQGLASSVFWTGVTPPDDIVTFDEMQTLITG
jgi:shikimate dehydrogenase